MTRTITSRGVAKILALFMLVIGAPAFAQDLSVVAISAPQDGCALNATNNVTLRLFNFGPTLPAASSFNVSYTINGGGPVTEMVVLGSNLLSNGTLNYTFTTQANLSVPGTYTFAATVALPGDINPANNAINNYSVTNSAPSVGGTVAAVPPGSSGVLTVSNFTGSIVQWEQSDDGGLRWIALANQTTTQAFANLRAPATFRARVRNGLCAEAVSNGVVVTP